MTIIPVPGALGGPSFSCSAVRIGPDVLRLAAAAYLGRFKGPSRQHSTSDLTVFFTWCAGQHLDPLAAGRADLERYVRWMQETRCFKPSTVSRRVSVVAGFYRTAVIDGLLDHSPAEHLRRPRVPPVSPTLGLTHLQFEALLTAARGSPNRSDFALVAFLGLLGLRIFEACRLDLADLREEHGHRVLRELGKGCRTTLVPLPPAVGRAVDRATAGRDHGPILPMWGRSHPGHLGDPGGRPWRAAGSPWFRLWNRIHFRYTISRW